MKDTASVSPRNLALAQAFAHRLAEQCDARLFQVPLFGFARGVILMKS